jgi:uncharacterized membrane protein (UPF0127 family)
MMKVWNRTRGVLLGERIRSATESASRREGLLKRTGLEPGEGLWIAPCEAVHCFFMKFTIDVVFIDKKRRVVKLAPGLKPWRVAGSLRAHSVIELREGTIAATGTAVGDQLEFEEAEAAE